MRARAHLIFVLGVCAPTSRIPGTKVVCYCACSVALLIIVGEILS